MTSSARRGGLLAVLSLCALASAAMAGPTRFVTIDYPSAVTTNANGINPAGDIVGSYVDSDGHQHGFVRRGATFSSFDYRDPETNTLASWTAGYGINPQGDIVGQYGVKGNANTYGFLLRDGAFYPVKAPLDVAPSTMPYGISPEGTITGCVHGGVDMYGFVVTADGQFSRSTLGGTMHTGIDSLGDVIGYGSNPDLPGSDSGYVIRHGALTWFRFDAFCLFTRPRGISPTGDIVGVYQDAAKQFHGFFLSRHGQIRPINVDLPGATNTRAFGINAVGDIVGSYVDDAKKTHGFLLNRGPE